MGLLNPAHVVADLGVDPRLVFLSATIAPGDNALELSIADHRATRVTLGGKEEPVRAQGLRRGEKGSKVFLLSPGTTFPCADPPRSPSFPGKSALVLTLYPYSPSLLLPLFLNCRSVEAKKR